MIDSPALQTKCTFTCCQEWKIAVDNETNRKWKKKYPPQEVKVQRKNLSAYNNQKGRRQSDPTG